MATIINNPGTPTVAESGNSNMLVGTVLVIVLILAALYFGLPYIRGAGRSAPSNTPANVQNNVQSQPTTPDNGTQINVPDHVDVNVDGNK